MMPSTVIDLRSDTVTKPTPGMREAMARAEVGDDVYGEDPTVNRLEALAAELLGKESALFVPTGAMGNTCAVLTHCGRGDEVILGDMCHISYYEVGASATFGGLPFRTIANEPSGQLPLDAIERNIRIPSLHTPRTGLICLENTHNRCGGAVLTADYIASVCELAAAHDTPVHLDGARLFNAAAYLGCDVKDLTRNVATVNVCLSKGLAAPVGSLVTGTRDFIERARKTRKMLGGGMRQAGVIAAAGVVALETMRDRLVEDHATARRLAQGLAALPGLRVDVDRVQTNIVILDVEGGPEAAEAFCQAARTDGVLYGNAGQGKVRAVTHYPLSARDIDDALARTGRALGAVAA